MQTLGAQLTQAGLDIAVDGLTITCRTTTMADVTAVLQELVAKGPADAVNLAADVMGKEGNKYDAWLSESLLNEDYAVRRLNTHGSYAVIAELLAPNPR